MEFIITSEEKLEEIISRVLAQQNKKPIGIAVPTIETATYPAVTNSIKELSTKVLKCSPVTTQKLKNSGKIRFKQFGRKCIFITSEVLEDIAKLSDIKQRRGNKSIEKGTQY